MIDRRLFLKGLSALAGMAGLAPLAAVAETYSFTLECNANHMMEFDGEDYRIYNLRDGGWIQIQGPPRELPPPGAFRFCPDENSSMSIGQILDEGASEPWLRRR